MEKEKINKVAEIKRHFQAGLSLTSWDAIVRWRATRLSAVVHDLETRCGRTFARKQETNKETGGTYTRYRLISGETYAHDHERGRALRETKRELQDRRRVKFKAILQTYRDGHDDMIGFSDLTPYCIRVTKRIKRSGRRTDLEAGTVENGSIFTGAEVAILDIFFTNLRFHDLLNNRRGHIYGRWEDTITKLLDKLINLK